MRSLEAFNHFGVPFRLNLLSLPCVLLFSSSSLIYLIHFLLQPKSVGVSPLISQSFGLANIKELAFSDEASWVLMV